MMKDGTFTVTGTVEMKLDLEKMRQTMQELVLDLSTHPLVLLIKQEHGVDLSTGSHVLFVPGNWRVDKELLRQDYVRQHAFLDGRNCILAQRSLLTLPDHFD